jgi:hypothetical protein
MIRKIYLLVLIAAATVCASAQQNAPHGSNLEGRVSALESKVRQASEVSAVGLLFGAFCALWAQNTGRSAWLWFFLGLFFSVIAVLVLLSKNSGDLDQQRRQGKKPFDLHEFRQQ